jgi:hypothetical protein
MASRVSSVRRPGSLGPAPTRTTAPVRSQVEAERGQNAHLLEPFPQRWRSYPIYSRIEVRSKDVGLLPRDVHTPADFRSFRLHLSGRKPRVVPVACKSRASSVPDRGMSEIPFNLRKLRSQSASARIREGPRGQISRVKCPQPAQNAPAPSRDRIFSAWLSRLWRSWRSGLLLLQTETMIRWHREGFRLSWRWKPRSPGGCLARGGEPGPRSSHAPRRFRLARF